jgi:pseudouridine kinase
VVCIGGAVVDRKLHLLAPAVPATSNPARSASAFGGVARNIAENLLRLGLDVALVSRIGADDAGSALVGQLAALGADVRAVVTVPGASTAQYVAVLDPAGDLVIGIADMAVLDAVTADDVDAAWPVPGTFPQPWVVSDCNLGPAALAAVLRHGRASGVPVAVDAVSTPKVTRLPADLSGVAVLFCNQAEARALLTAYGRQDADQGAGDADVEDAAEDDEDDEDDAAELAVRLLRRGAGAVVLTRGADGVVLAGPDGVSIVPASVARVVDVTGAGDALVAGTVAALAAGHALPDAVAVGTLVAARTVESEHSVVPDLPPQVRALFAPTSALVNPQVDADPCAARPRTLP